MTQSVCSLLSDFTKITSENGPSFHDSMRKILSLSPFYRQENRSSENVSELSRLTRLYQSEVGFDV